MPADHDGSRHAIPVRHWRPDHHRVNVLALSSPASLVHRELSPLILVVGATGALGGAIVRTLLAEGLPVRAFGRNRDKLLALASLGVDVVAGDLLDPDAVTRACAGASQLVTTANNIMGSGASSPLRVDLPAHRNLLKAAEREGLERLIYVSARGTGGAASPVDFFRVKHEIEEMVTRTRVPYVILRPTAFLETWAALLIGDSIRRKRVALLFGDGRQVSNFIAIDDVASFVARILQRPDITNEIIDIGGPSNLTFDEVATLVERELGVTARRRHVPVAVLRLGARLLRPFHEVAARTMALGLFSATTDGTFAEWKHSADRFGVSPMSAEQFIARWSKRDTE